MPFDPHFIARLMPALLEGAEVTVELALLTISICLVWGLVVALAQAVEADRLLLDRAALVPQLHPEPVGRSG